MHVLRELWGGEPVDFRGEHLQVEGAQIVPAPVWPEIHLGGSPLAALDVAPLRFAYWVPKSLADWSPARSSSGEQILESLSRLLQRITGGGH